MTMEFRLVVTAYQENSAEKLLSFVDANLCWRPTTKWKAVVTSFTKALRLGRKEPFPWFAPNPGPFYGDIIISHDIHTCARIGCSTQGIQCGYNHFVSPIKRTHHNYLGKLLFGNGEEEVILHECWFCRYRIVAAFVRLTKHKRKVVSPHSRIYTQHVTSC